MTSTAGLAALSLPARPDEWEAWLRTRCDEQLEQAAYHTYMWSLVIAKDLFSAFDRDDLFAPATARRYRDSTLSPGGSEDAARLVEDFLGWPYNFEAFSRWLEQ